MKPIFGLRFTLACAGVCLVSNTALADSLPKCDGVETQIHRAVFTTKVENREPVDDLDTLPESPEQIYLFTDVRKGKDTRVSHVWYSGGQRIAFANLNIGSSRWRTWSRLAGSLISGEDIRVDLIHNEQCLLLRKELPSTTVASSENTPAEVEPEPVIEQEPAEESIASTATDEAEVAVDESTSREKNKLSAKDYAERVKEAAQHYRDAQYAKLSGDYDQAEISLQNAIDSIPESSPSREDLNHELHYEIPLLRLDGYILALDQVAGQRVYESLLDYIDGRPDKQSLQAQLAEYKLKLDAME